jgi:hypothetical protein
MACTDGKARRAGPEADGSRYSYRDDVYNHEGEDLGDIKEIMLDMNNG